jgi:hypothetical protein
MGILKIKMYSLSNPLHLQFVLDVLNLIQKFNPELLKVVSLYEILQACIEIEDLCYKIIYKSDISKLKKDKDHERDTVIISIKDAVKSALRSLDPNVSGAADRVKIVLEAFDRPQLLTKLPYDAETASVNNFLQELEEKYADDVKITGLETLLKELRVRNDDFDKLAKDYNKQQAEKPSVRSKEARKKTDKAYQDVITLINANIINDGEAPYASFLTELNTLIKHYNDLIAQHRGYLNAAKEKAKAKKEAEKKAKEEAEKKAKEEAEKKAKEDAEKKATEDAEKKAKEEAEKKAKEEAEKKAKEDAEKKAKEDSEKKTKETDD